MSDVNAVDIPL